MDHPSPMRALMRTTGSLTSLLQIFKFNKYTGIAGGLVSHARRMLTASHPLTASVMG